ncbi:MAG: NUDIX hydrolase [Deltaproteobacteria bacterium]|nr:NUDIX hydrolase [Deltaproteobacteria bacterium]
MVEPDQVVLVQRANPPAQGTWTLPGGKVDRGESLVAAARREVREETGLDVEIGALVEVIEIVSDTHHYVILDYAARPVGGTLMAGDDAADVRLVPVAELATYGVTDAVARVVSRAFSRGTG